VTVGTDYTDLWKCLLNGPGTFPFKEHNAGSTPVTSTNFRPRSTTESMRLVSTEFGTGSNPVEGTTSFRCSWITTKTVFLERVVLSAL
jgi:hypothetical protein